MRYLGFILLLGLFSYQPGPKFPSKLSEYGLFQGYLKNQEPIAGVTPYELISPLFSDYAHKLRFVQLPAGQLVNYNPDSVFQFPVGTRIAKTFYFPNDVRKPNAGRRIMETRILSHEPTGSHCGARKYDVGVNIFHHFHNAWNPKHHRIPHVAHSDQNVI